VSANLYPSSFEDWIDPRSITAGVHAEIGETGTGSDTHKELLKICIYFYYAKLLPSQNSDGYGPLDEIIPLHAIDSLRVATSRHMDNRVLPS